MKITTTQRAILLAPVLAAAVGLASVSGVQAVDMATVIVGNAGNTGEWSGESYGGIGPDRICGAVDYVYNIGMYEVTNNQYAEFLNAVAASDSHDLYNTSMGSGDGGITRSGSPGSYTYSPIAGRVNKPVNYVSWYDALRFANWMHNGQGSGDTEDGAYDMSLGSGVVRKSGALVVLPSEDEWYKAAYYKGGGTSAGYWDHAGQSDTAPTAEGPPGTNTTNGSANYAFAVGALTDVGSYTFKPSTSAYGTFDQAGNVWEWNEADILGDGSIRGLRGGSLGANAGELPAAFRYYYEPTFEGNGSLGFRIAEVTPDAILAETDFGDVPGTDVSPFSTDYTPGFFPNDPTPPEYEVVTTASGHGPSSWDGVDHTTGTGCFMLANGAADSKLAVLSYSTYGVFGYRYTLSGWVMNVTASGASPAVLSFRVNGVQEGTFATPGAQTWYQFTFSYTPVVSGSMSLALHDNNTIAGANDFGLDDIVLSGTGTA